MKRLWLATTIALVLLTYAPQLGAPFELQDDHRIIAPIVKPHGGAIAMYIAELRSDFEHVGRFRPVNQIFDVIGPVVLGPRPLVWHLVSLLLAVAVAALLFFAGARAFGLPAAGAVLALVTLLAPDPGPTAAWYRLGPKEAWGMLFLAAALALMIARRSDVWTFVLVALTAYSKESFLLLVPALFGVRVWIEARAAGTTVPAALRRLRLFAIAYGLLFALGLAGVLVAIAGAGDQSYGSQSLEIVPAAIVRVLVRDAARAPMLAVWFVPVLLAVFVRRPPFIGIALFVLWVAPQYALYATRGGFWDHYWLPCVVAFAAANAAAIAVLERRPLLYRIALTVFAAWTINAVRIDVAAVLNHNEKARVQQEAVRIAAEQVTPGSDLVIIANPMTQSEIAPAFADFVRARGGRFRHAVLHDARGGDVPLAGAAVLLYLDPGRSGDPVPPGYERRAASGRAVYFSLRKLARVTIPIAIRVDVKGRRG